MTLPSSSSSRMFSRCVTCSKNTPGDDRAGVAASGSSAPAAKAADRRRLAVADAVDGDDQRRREAAGVSRRGGMTGVMVVEAQRRLPRPSAARSRAHRPSADGARRAFGGHSVMRYLARLCSRLSARGRPCGGAAGSTPPWSTETPGRASSPRRWCSRPPAARPVGVTPADLETPAIDRAGNRISSLRRVRRSSLTPRRVARRRGERRPHRGRPRRRGCSPGLSGARARAPPEASGCGSLIGRASIVMLRHLCKICDHLT